MNQSKRYYYVLRTTTTLLPMCWLLGLIATGACVLNAGRLTEGAATYCFTGQMIATMTVVIGTALTWAANEAAIRFEGAGSDCIMLDLRWLRERRTQQRYALAAFIASVQVVVFGIVNFLLPAGLATVTQRRSGFVADVVLVVMAAFLIYIYRRLERQYGH